MIPAIFAFIGRSIGRIMNTALGWATILLFGRVPQTRQYLLSALSLGALLWLICVIGIAFPRAGTWLLTFMVPEGARSHPLLRVAMLAGALVLPIAVGITSLFVLDPEDRPHGWRGRARVIARGYLFTPALGVTLLFLMVFAPWMRLGALFRRWKTQHVPIVVEPDDYASVVTEIRSALATAGHRTVATRAAWMIRAPTRLLTAVARGSFQRLLADELTRLRGDGLEVTLHPSDLFIRGRADSVYHARVTIAQQLAFSNAYLTWAKESQDLELELRSMWNEMRAGGSARAPAIADRLGTIDDELRRQPFPYEEWEVLYRKKLVVERALLQMLAGVLERPKEPKDAEGYERNTRLLQQALRDKR